MSEVNLNQSRFDVEIRYIPTIVFETDPDSKARKPTFYRKYTVNVKDRTKQTKTDQCYRFTLKE